MLHNIAVNRFILPKQLSLIFGFLSLLSISLPAHASLANAVPAVLIWLAVGIPLTIIVSPLIFWRYKKYLESRGWQQSGLQTIRLFFICCLGVFFFLTPLIVIPMTADDVMDFSGSRSSAPSLIIIVLIVLILFLTYFPKNRNDKLKEMADQYGFEYTAVTENPSEYCNLATRWLDNGSKSKLRVINLLHRDINGIQLRVFDLECAPSRRSTIKKNQIRTVVQVNLKEGRVPYFSLEPENIWHKLLPDVDISDKKEFSKMYFLTSKDPNIKLFFDSPLTNYFLTQNKIFAEGGEGSIVLCRNEYKISLKEMPTWLAAGEGLCEALSLKS